MFSIKEKGYTLIELVVVIGLISLLSTVIILNGAESRNLIQLQTAAQQLESVLTQAQAYGNSGRAYPAGTTNYDSGYGVFVTTDSGSEKNILMYGGLGDTSPADGTIDEDEEKYDTGQSQEFETITLGGNVEIGKITAVAPNANTSEGHILFRRGEEQVHLYSKNQSPEELIITLSSGSATIDVHVYETGLVYIDQ